MRKTKTIQKKRKRRKERHIDQNETKRVPSRNPILVSSDSTTDRKHPASSENLPRILRQPPTLLECVNEDDSRATAALASCNGHDERNTCFFVDGESLIFGIVIHFHTGSDDWVTGVENSMLLGGIFSGFSGPLGPQGVV